MALDSGVCGVDVEPAPVTGRRRRVQPCSRVWHDRGCTVISCRQARISAVPAEPVGAVVAVAGGHGQGEVGEGAVDYRPLRGDVAALGGCDPGGDGICGGGAGGVGFVEPGEEAVDLAQDGCMPFSTRATPQVAVLVTNSSAAASSGSQACTTDRMPGASVSRAARIAQPCGGRAGDRSMSGRLRARLRTGHRFSAGRTRAREARMST